MRASSVVNSQSALAWRLLRYSAISLSKVLGWQYGGRGIGAGSAVLRRAPVEARQLPCLGGEGHSSHGIRLTSTGNKLRRLLADSRHEQANFGLQDCDAPPIQPLVAAVRYLAGNLTFPR